MDEVKNKKWSDQEFLSMREDVLAQWPTGKQIRDLDEAVAYHKTMPETKVFARKIQQHKKTGQPCIGLQEGRCLLENQVASLQRLVHAGADYFYLFPDTYTRRLWLDRAQQGLEASRKEGKDLLNGFPYINYGLAVTRQMTESIDHAICSMCNDDDPRLVTEMAFAGGATISLMHELRCLVTHSKNYPLALRIRNSQYIAKLAAWYTERGAPICLIVTEQLFGFCPPGISIASAIATILMAATQGVKHIALNLEQQASLVQDIAASRVFQSLTEEYLRKFGFDDVQLSFCWTDPQREFPHGEQRCASLLGILSGIAALGGGYWRLCKSPQESLGVPSVEANIAAVDVAKQAFMTFRKQRVPDNKRISEEERILRLDAKAMLDKVLEMGEGDVVSGKIEAVKSGLWDFPFSSWLYVKGNVLPASDLDSCIRWLDHGNLPLPNEVIQFHKEKLAERAHAEKRKGDIRMVIGDLRSLALP